jgi:hypothetical protein
LDPISFDIKNNISTSWVLHMGVTYDIWLNSVNWWISFFHGGSWEDGMGCMLVFIYLEPQKRLCVHRIFIDKMELHVYIWAFSFFGIPNILVGFRKP